MFILSRALCEFDLLFEKLNIAMQVHTVHAVLFILFCCFNFQYQNNMCLKTKTAWTVCFTWTPCEVDFDKTQIEVTLTNCCGLEIALNLSRGQVGRWGCRLRWGGYSERHINKLHIYNWLFELLSSNFYYIKQFKNCHKLSL